MQRNIWHHLKHDWEETMSVKMFTMTHKEFPKPLDPVYIPLHVGRILSKDLGYMGDHTGDQISYKNSSFCELTGMYWIWKNLKTNDNVGICHYRRYPVNDSNVIMNEKEYDSILREYDLITTKKLTLNFSYYEGYAANHNIRDLDITGEVIRQKYPEYNQSFQSLVHENHTYFGNIIVTSKEIFDRYSEWLFTILFEVEARIDISGYDDYHRRVFGFLSEFLLMVWIDVNKIKVYECKIGMTAEKYETADMKDVLADYFAHKDFLGAKNYFLEVLKRRPDVLMEASDINGELKLAMQMIATFELEYDKSGKSILDRINNFQELISLFETLNLIITRAFWNEIQSEDVRYLEKYDISEYMIEVSIQIMANKQIESSEIFNRIKKE